MKTIKNPSTIFKYHGKLCEVIGITNSKVIEFREVGAKKCECCGEIKTYSEVESSPNFQDSAEAVETLNLTK
jgi:hypothetical protein